MSPKINLWLWTVVGIAIFCFSIMLAIRGYGEGKVLSVAIYLLFALIAVISEIRSYLLYRMQLRLERTLKILREDERRKR